MARAAAIAGIGWVVLNRDVEYIAELRKAYRIPAFCITSDHEEIGRIQGQQFAAILPCGGAVLYIQGPSESLAAKQRTFGMYETKPAEVQVKLMKAQWTEASAQRTVSSWLRLSTSQQTHLDLIAAQDDSMALGREEGVPGRIEFAGTRALAEAALHRLRRTSEQRANLGEARSPDGHNLCSAKRWHGSGDARRSHSKRHHASRALNGSAGVDSSSRCFGQVPRRKNPGSVGRRRVKSPTSHTSNCY